MPRAELSRKAITLRGSLLAVRTDLASKSQLAGPRRRASNWARRDLSADLAAASSFQQTERARVDSQHALFLRDKVPHAHPTTALVMRFRGYGFLAARAQLF